MQNKDAGFLPWLLLLILALIWGSSFILIKKGLTEFSPIQVGCLRIATAFLIFLPITIYNAKNLPWKRWRWLMLGGFLGSFFPSLLFSWAGAHLPSSISGTLNALTPLITFGIGIVFFHSTIGKWKIAGLLFGLLGALLLALQKGGFADGINPYVIPVFIATIFYALNANLLKFKLGDLKPLVVATLSLTLAGFFPFLILLFDTDFHAKLLNGATHTLGFWSVIFLGASSTALANVLFNKLIQVSSPVFASSVTYLMPVVAIVWGLLDSETINSIQLVGLSGILLGVYLVNFK